MVLACEFGEGLKDKREGLRGEEGGRGEEGVDEVYCTQLRGRRGGGGDKGYELEEGGVGERSRYELTVLFAKPENMSVR